MPHLTRDIKRFEEISNNGWPALQTMQYDGWLLRFAEGVTKRSNSVSMLYPSRIPFKEKIAFCETVYHQQGIAPCFKIVRESETSVIDSILEDQGYSIPATISFQMLTIGSSAPKPESAIHIETGINDAWIDHFIRMNRFEKSRKRVYLAIMKQVLTPKCLVSVVANQQTIGVGLGVLEADCIGLFDLVVDPDHRNRGIGADIVKAILHWGHSMGARKGYLQVLTDNTQAISVYRKLGFAEIYQYWYRMKR